MARTGKEAENRSEDEMQRLVEKFRTNAHIWAKMPFPYEDLNDKWTRKDRQEQRRGFKQDLDSMVQDPSNPSEIIEDGAIQMWQFETEYGPVVYEKLLHISITDKEPFKKTKFLADFQKLCAPWYNMNPSPCVEALQLQLAKVYLAMPKGYRDNKGHHKEPKTHIQASYDTLWAMSGGESDWNRVKDEHVALLQDEDPERQPLRKILQEVLEKWSRWKRFAEDYLHNNQRNSFTSTNEGYYRKPPKDALYILVDKNHKLVILLDPNGITNAYGPDVKAKMEEDTDNYFAIKKPASTEGNQRWRGDKEHFELNPHLTKAECGTDYYGSWHPAGHPNGPMYITPDARNLQGIEKEVMMEYMKGAHGQMNKLVDFWFGVFDPELQQEYRNVYKVIPETARLPPTCAEEEETFSLRAILRNRQTYEHVDMQDWNGGLVGLLQLGFFYGGALVFNQLRLQLDGYRSGAVVLFRGNLLKHFVQPWQGLNRTAFDFTTKETVRKAGKLSNSQPKPDYESEHTVAASTADTAGAAYLGGQEDLLAVVDASHVTSLGKRRRSQIEEADDYSNHPRTQPVATSLAPPNNPVNYLEATTAEDFGIQEQADFATLARQIREEVRAEMESRYSRGPGWKRAG